MSLKFRDSESTSAANNLLSSFSSSQRISSYDAAVAAYERLSYQKALAALDNVTEMDIRIFVGI